MARRKKTKKRKRVSQLRQQYLKERRRVSNMVTRLRKKGYDVHLSDIVGDIPARVTKKRLQQIQAITSSKIALQQVKDVKMIPETVTDGVIEMTADEYAVYLFREKFDSYHPEVQKAVNMWVDYLIDNFGIEELSAALDVADYEGVELSSYGGYLIPPDDLELYLHQMSHFIMGGPDADLGALTEEVGEIIHQYEANIEDYDLEAYGSWHFRNRVKKYYG